MATSSPEFDASLEYLEMFFFFIEILGNPELYYN
jgi:hypothetical protein